MNPIELHFIPVYQIFSGAFLAVYAPDLCLLGSFAFVDTDELSSRSKILGWNNLRCELSLYF